MAAIAVNGHSSVWKPYCKLDSDRNINIITCYVNTDILYIYSSK